MYYIFPGALKNTILTDKELISVRDLLEKCIEENNAQQLKRYEALRKSEPQARMQDFIIDLRKYKIQIVCVVAPNGKKVAWLNGLCGAFERDWTKEILEVEDGGNCFFNLKIDLTNNRYYDFFVNGDA
jgi:hypothetical protein